MRKADFRKSIKITKMSSEFVWAIKNGDLEQVKDIIEKQVSDVFAYFLTMECRVSPLLYHMSHMVLFSLNKYAPRIVISLSVK